MPALKPKPPKSSTATPRAESRANFSNLASELRTTLDREGGSGGRTRLLIIGGLAVLAGVGWFVLKPMFLPEVVIAPPITDPEVAAASTEAEPGAEPTAPGDETASTETAETTAVEAEEVVVVAETGTEAQALAEADQTPTGAEDEPPAAGLTEDEPADEDSGSGSWFGGITQGMLTSSNRPRDEAAPTEPQEPVQPVTITPQVAASPELLRKLESFEAKLAAIDQGLVRIEDRLRQQTDQIAIPIPTPTPAALPAPTFESADVTQTITMFRNGQFNAALPGFEAICQHEPSDARIWYYAALCRGFVTNQWDGETEDWVQRGVALESQGVPTRSLIEDEFAFIPAESGRTWLDYYRKKAR